MKARIVVYMMFFAVIAMAAVPQIIQYQGKLTDMSGIGENDTLDIRFRIFDVETGGDSLWAMTIADVAIVHGMFDVNIGPIDLPFDEQYWLEIVVDENVLAPRVQLTSSPYAFRAAVADSFTGGVPPWTQDTMVAHWDSLRNVPTGFADGVDDTGSTIGTQDTMIAHWDSLRNIPAGFADGIDNDGGSDGDWTIDGSNVYSAVSGNAGIGTTTPRSKLHVEDYDDTIGIDNGVFISVSNTCDDSSALSGVRFKTRANTDDLFYKGAIAFQRTTPQGRGNILFLNNDRANNTNADISDVKMTITRAGDVGIGTMTPQAKLDVAGITRTSNFAMPTGANDGYLLQSDASGNASWVSPSLISTVNDSDWIKTGSNMYAGVSGNVGIGTTTPNKMLTISGPTPEIQFQDTDTTNKWHIGQNSGSFFITETDVAHRLSLSSGGNVGIGTTTPNAKLSIQNSALLGAWDGNLKVYKSSRDVSPTGSAIVAYSNDFGIPEAYNYTIARLGCYDSIPGGGVSEIPVWGQAISISMCGVLATYGSNPVSPIRWAYLAGGDYSGYFSDNVKIDNSLFVDSKIGIGTINPVDLLHVEAFDSTIGTNDSAFISIRNKCNADSALTGIRFKSHSTDGNNFYKSAIVFQRTKTWGRGNLHFIMNDQENGLNADLSATKMTLTSAGQLGIGTTSPTSLLTISGAFPEIQFIDTDTTTKWHIGQNSGSFFITETGVAHRLAINAGGNVGIGTTTAGAKTEIYANSGGTWPQLLLKENGADFARLFFANTDTTAFFAIVGKPADDPVNAKMNFYYGGDRMTIQGDGNVGIGTTAPTSKLQINGDLATQNGKIRRDFITYCTSTGSSENIPVHIKTNIARGSAIMYRFQVEGYHYGAGRIINSVAAGTSAYDSGGPYADQTQDYSNGADISLYYSADNYLVVKLTFPDNSYRASFSVSAWFTAFSGSAWDIEAEIFQQSSNL